MTALRCIGHLLKNLTSWLGMARGKQCSLSEYGEMQDMQRHDDSATTIERRPA